MTLSNHPATLPLRCAPILDYLEHQLPQYPFDPELDRPFVEELLDDFGHLDVLEQIKRYRWFHDNQPPNDRPRLALRRWLAASRTWS